jgi:integrase
MKNRKSECAAAIYDRREAQKLIAAAGKRGGYPERDELLLRLAHRHGLRASEAVGLRWDSFDLDGGSSTIVRAKGGRTSTHTVARDDLSALRKMRKATTDLGYLRQSAAARCRLTRCSTSSVRQGSLLDWAMSCIPTCCAMVPGMH